LTARRSLYLFTDSAGFGGAEESLLTLLAGLDRDAWAPTLVHHPERGVAPLVERARELGADLWPVPRMPDGLPGVRGVPRFAWHLRKRRPAVFHAHLTWPLGCKFGLAGAVLARVPAIVGTVQLFPEFAPTALAVLQQRVLASGVDRYLAVSEHVEARLRQAFHWPSRKIAVVPNAIDLARFAGERDLDLYRSLSSDGAAVVLTVARLEEQKGLEYLLEAASRLPEVRFAIAGEGSARVALQQRAAALGVDGRVVFLGRRTDVPRLLAACDLFVLPSLWEGLPISVLEAMAAGKPVVATAIGGTAEAVIHGQTGMLVPARDGPALADAIATLLGDRALAGRLAMAALERVRSRFSSEAMVAAVVSVYEELLGRRREHGRD
jgi:glycosyltransferase involved in cell wall biosynthesis